jgi:hypothetical protein
MKERTKQTINDYVNKRYAPGGFIRSVLSNDLVGSVANADEENQRDLVEIVKYVYNHTPSGCWGSREIVDNWLNNATDEDCS